MPNFIPCMVNKEDKLLVVDQCVSFKGSNGNTYFGRIVEFDPKLRLAFVVVTYQADDRLMDLVLVTGKGLVEHPLKEGNGIIQCIDNLSPLESGQALLKEWAEDPYKDLYIEPLLAVTDGWENAEHGVISVIGAKIKAAEYIIENSSFDFFKEWVSGMCDAPVDDTESEWDTQTFIDAYVNPNIEHIKTLINEVLDEEPETNVNEAVNETCPDEDDELEQYEKNATEVIQFILACKRLLRHADTVDEANEIGNYMRAAIIDMEAVTKHSIFMADKTCDFVDKLKGDK